MLTWQCILKQPICLAVILSVIISQLQSTLITAQLWYDMCHSQKMAETGKMRRTDSELHAVSCQLQQSKALWGFLNTLTHAICMPSVLYWLRQNLYCTDVYIQLWSDLLYDSLHVKNLSLFVLCMGKNCCGLFKNINPRVSFWSMWYGHDTCAAESHQTSSDKQRSSWLWYQIYLKAWRYWSSWLARLKQS